MDDEQKDENEFDVDFDPKKASKGGSIDDDDLDLDDGLPHEPEIVDPLLVDDETVTIDKVLDEEEAEDDDSMDDKDNEYGI